MDVRCNSRGCYGSVFAAWLAVRAACRRVSQVLLWLLPRSELVTQKVNGSGMKLLPYLLQPVHVQSLAEATPLQCIAALQGLLFMSQGTSTASRSRSRSSCSLPDCSLPFKVYEPVSRWSTLMTVP